jgi:hypothetical protein
MATGHVREFTMRRTSIGVGILAGLLASCSGVALSVQSRAAKPAAPLIVGDTTTIVVPKPTVIAYLVIPEGAVDSQPDVAVLADDWNIAMSILGDSLEAHGIAFALVTESRLVVRSAGTADTVFDLAAGPAAGYVYARPGETPCVRRGAAELDDVLTAARMLVDPRVSAASRARQCPHQSP